MSSQTLKFAVFFLALFTIHSGCNIVDCNNTIEKGEPIMSIELFPEHKETYMFVSNYDTITLKKDNVYTTQNTKANCSVDINIAGNSSCSCSNSHSEIYSDDDLKFSQLLTYRFYESAEAKALIECDVVSIKNGQLCGLNASMDLSQTTAALGTLVTNIEIEGYQFNRMFIASSSDNSTILLIKPNEGAVAFYVDGILYELVN